MATSITLPTASSTTFSSYDYTIRNPFETSSSYSFRTAQTTEKTTVWIATASIGDLTAVAAITDVESEIFWQEVASWPGSDTILGSTSCQLSDSHRTWCTTKQVRIAPYEDFSYTITRTATTSIPSNWIYTLTPMKVVHGQFHPAPSSTTELYRIETPTSAANSKSKVKRVWLNLP